MSSSLDHTRIRLFTEAPLSEGGIVPLSPEQTHYLKHVMRRDIADAIALFNGRDGEYSANIQGLHKSGGEALVEKKLREQREEPDLWLLFAPLKSNATEFLVEKATELGVSALQPIFTQRTIASRVNIRRLRAHAIEAAEQSERLTVPDIRDVAKFYSSFELWPKDRVLIWCDESGEAPSIQTALHHYKASYWAILTGPEGGFTREEFAFLRNQPYVLPVSLGPRVMRADTAALAALACWQALQGDWNISRT